MDIKKFCAYGWARMKVPVLDENPGSSEIPRCRGYTYYGNR